MAIKISTHPNIISKVLLLSWSEIKDPQIAPSNMPRASHLKERQSTALFLEWKRVALVEVTNITASDVEIAKCI